ncbi:hypothetical protein C8R47DRAFT_1102612, partial [Mycena vitilis]
MRLLTGCGCVLFLLATIFFPFLITALLGLCCSPGPSFLFVSLSRSPRASVAAAGARPRHRRPVLPLLDVPELHLLGQIICDQPSASRSVCGIHPNSDLLLCCLRRSAAALQPELVAPTVCMHILAVFDVGSHPSQPVLSGLLCHAARRRSVLKTRTFSCMHI